MAFLLAIITALALHFRPVTLMTHTHLGGMANWPLVLGSG
jgi:hypothetical protein